MANLLAAALFFVGIHLFISGTALRDRLAARLGELPYRGIFSLLSAGGLAWLVLAYLHARVPQPTPFFAQRQIAAALMLLAWLFVAYGVLTIGPTAVGGERGIGAAEARGIHRITRHPMLWGFALWAATHLVFNPDPVNLVFFGAFLVLALAGPRSIDAKRARRFGADWARYARSTSNIPFLAIAQKRNQLKFGELEWWKAAIGAAVFVLFLTLHTRLFGVPPL